MRVGSKVRGPFRVPVVDHQRMAVTLMALKMGMIRRQVVMGVLDLGFDSARPEAQANKDADSCYCRERK